ncbi:MAG TPA: alpha/beta fold hydrolase [Thermohalobaculum sp.]|nr:alpha/beta fold hydrolase [Thermohalobaculum sp.]
MTRPAPGPGPDPGPGPGPDPGETTARRLAGLARRLAETRGGAAIEIAVTPKDEVWREGRITLHRYRPVVPRPRLGPLMILHGLIGRQTMTDLEPGRSLVARLLEAGIDLWVLDWGNPTRADRFKDFTDYAEHHLGDALAALRAASGAPKAALFGICEGGVFAAIHAARHPDRVLGLALAVTPIDFHADALDPDPRRGLLNVWVRSLPPELIRALIDERGNLPGQLTGALFQQLAPARTLAKYTADLVELADDPAALDTFLRMEKWLADRPDHPGAAAKEWLIGLYHENRLVEGRFEIAGAPVDLSAIACPVLNIFAAEDHIIPPPSSRALGPILAGRDYRELEVPTGHVGVFVARRAQRIVAPAISRWLARIARSARPAPASAKRRRRSA